MLMRYCLLCLITLCVSVFAQPISGIWKLTNKTRPYNFASTIAYNASFKFNTDGTIQLLGQTGNITKSTRRYELKHNELIVYLLDSNNNRIPWNSSSKVFILTQINSKCFNALDMKEKGNTFTMCKTQ
jgi:hypothetical protein